MANNEYHSGMREFAEWMKDEIESKKAQIIEHDGRPYLLNYDKLEPIKQPALPCVEATTLTGLVDFIEFKGIDENSPYYYIHVVSPTQVRLMSNHKGPFLQTDCLMDVKAVTPRIMMNSFIDQESFIIQAQSCFKNTDDLEKVVAVAGNLREQNVKDTCDDGVSQVVTAKSGVARLADVVVPRQVYLAPICTFPEIIQPASAFVFRIQDGPRMGLIEADGGAWRNTAMQLIKDYLEEAICCKVIA